MDRLPDKNAGASRLPWRAEKAPEALFSDRALADAARGICGALRAEADGCVMLALPIDDTSPIPLMAAFCLGEPWFIDGAEYLVFTVRSGSPTSPVPLRRA
ncbi:MAG: hypothetical protein LBC21_00930 [Oscillospiraceae bacterium]|nr:hypothetical protein [Oscillospiraceae bacterium]